MSEFRAHTPARPVRGARPRVGVVVPSGSLLDREYWELGHEYVDLFFSRLDPIPGLMSRDRALAMTRSANIRPAVARLLDVNPAVVAFACTSASFSGGIRGERQLRETLQTSGAPGAVTTSGSLVAALHRLGVSRVSVATPYVAELSENLVSFLLEAGFEVGSVYSHGMTDPSAVADLDASTVMEMGRTARTGDEEAVFMSCTNLPTHDVRTLMRAELGAEILSSNQVTTWAAIRAAGVGAGADRILVE